VPPAACAARRPYDERRGRPEQQTAAGRSPPEGPDGPARPHPPPVPGRADVPGRAETPRRSGVLGGRGPVRKGRARLPLLLRGLAVTVAGYLAALSGIVSSLTGIVLLTEDPTSPVSGVAILLGGALALPLALYYGVARLTARSTPLTLTWQGRLRWALTAYVLTLLLAVLLYSPSTPLLPLPALPAAFIVGKRTFRAALAACALLACLVAVLW
jgi:hypothetical protein